MPMCSHAVGEVFLVEDMQTLGFGGPLIHVYACVHTRYVHLLVHVWRRMVEVLRLGVTHIYLCIPIHGACMPMQTYMWVDDVGSMIC